MTIKKKNKIKFEQVPCQHTHAVKDYKKTGIFHVKDMTATIFLYLGFISKPQSN